MRVLMEKAKVSFFEAGRKLPYGFQNFEESGPPRIHVTEPARQLSGLPFWALLMECVK